MSDNKDNKNKDKDKDKDNKNYNMCSPILNYGIYDNLLSKIDIDYDNEVCELSKYILNFKEVRDDVVEDGIVFPSFANCFYEMIENYGYIPSQEMFCNYYYESRRREIDETISYFTCGKNIDKDKDKDKNRIYKSAVEFDIDSEQFKDRILVGLDARIRRAYPSFVRDFMFNLYVYDHCYDVYCLYNVKLDLSCGIDSLVVKDDLLFGICLYVDTSRSIGYRKRKKSDRHCDYGNVVMIENPLCYSNRFKCGDFWLYKEDSIEKMLDCL